MNIRFLILLICTITLISCIDYATRITVDQTHKPDIVIRIDRGDGEMYDGVVLVNDISNLAYDKYGQVKYKSLDDYKKDLSVHNINIYDNYVIPDNDYYHADRIIILLNINKYNHSKSKLYLLPYKDNYTHHATASNETTSCMIIYKYIDVCD